MDDGLPCSGLDNNTASLPLLMEHMSSVSDQEHVVVNVTSMRPTISVAPHDGMSGSVESQEGTSSSGTDARIERASPSTARTNFGRGGELRPFRRRQRTSTLNPGLWIFIKFTITIGQILASIIVLSVSRNEKPEAPLFDWIIGYAAGCVATLPHLYWRYKNRYVRASVHDPSSTSFVTQSNPPSSEDPHYTAISMPEASLQEGGESSQASNNNSDTISRNQRIGVLIGRFKMAVDCFFAVWFVVGNVWVFGSQSSARDAPNLYRLCIVFLAFSCIGYAMPFIFCGIICCCLPCMISILRWREDQTETRGASMEVIDSMPKYKFKEIRFTERNSSRDDSETDSETSCNGGVIGAGTGNERPVSAEDAVCCICLSRYKDGEELRELPCIHCFHVDCVDKWLQRNASCPLCKHYISESSERTPDSTGEIGQRSEGQTLNNT